MDEPRNPPNARPLRLLWVSTELRTGGAERCLTRLAVDWLAQGYESEVVSLAPLPSERRELVELLAAHSIPIHSLEARKFWQWPSVTSKLARHIDRFKPDAIVSFLFHANLATSKALRKSAHRAPWLANLRVSDPRRWRLWLEKRAYRTANQVICVSQDVAQGYRESGIESSKLLVIPNGVDLPTIDAQSANQKREAIEADLAIVGRLHAQKGIDGLLHSWKQAPESTRRLKLAIVGEGPEREPLQRLAESLGLASQIQWVSWQSQPWSYLRNVPIVLVPSRFEGMANVMLEAMAARKVVLVTEVQGVKDVFPRPLEQVAQVAGSESTRWQVVPPEAWSEIWVKASQVVANQRLRESLRAANRARIEDAFSWEVTRDAFERAIRRSI